MSSHPHHHPLLLEVPVFSPASASRALAAGAHRLELNRGGSYPAGGLTPSIPDLEVVSRGCGVPLRVMIRPRGIVVAAAAADGGGAGSSGSTSRATQDGVQGDGAGSGEAQTPDFIYTDAEFEEMKQCVEVMIASPGLLRPERGDGFVFGVLKKKVEEVDAEEKDKDDKVKVVVDVERNAELVRLAGGLPCVFHRAFDDVLGSNGATPEAALADLATCGFHGLLTSGGPGAAAEHPDVLKQIIRTAATAADGSGGRSSLREIIVGGGVRSVSVARLREVLDIDGLVGSGSGVEVWFHSSCLTGQGGSGKGSGPVGEGQVEDNQGKDGEEDEDVVDEDELRAIVKALV